MTLKEKMKRGPVFGMACFTGTTCVIENIAMSGLDFIYLDLDHDVVAHSLQSIECHCRSR